MINIKIKKWDTLFPYFISFIFITLSIILISRHELWFDEVRAWVIGASSSSFAEFVNYMRDSEGHPYTWSAILFLVYKFFTQNVEVIKIIHLLISSIAVFLFLKYSTFNKVIKTIFVFGYFSFYEYSIISRNYALGVLLIYIFCILYKEKYKNITSIAITLFFMGQANIFSFLVSLVFFALVLIESFIERKKISIRFFNLKIIIYILVFICSPIVLFWQLGGQATQGSVWGPALPAFFNKSFNEIFESVNGAVRGAFYAIIPFNEIQINFWGNNLFINNLIGKSNIAILVLSIILLLIPVLFIKKRKIIFYLIGIFSILIIPVFIPMGKLRHYGHLFILMISMIWISNYNNDDDEFLFKNQITIKRISNIFLTVILLFGLASSGFAFYFDYKYPFTVQKEIAGYIKENFELDKTTLISGYKDVDSTSVAAYLNKKIYYPQTDEFSLISSYGKRKADLNADEVFLKTLSYGRQNEQILLILNNKLITDPDIPSRYFFKKINKDFGDSIVGYENAGLYIFKKDDIKLARINDAGTFPDAELHGCTISEDKTKIAFDSDKEGLKLFRFPVEIEKYTNYLIEFDLTVDNNITDNILVDLYGEDYDDPFQEFSIKAEEIRIGEKIKISKILNSLSIPDKEIFFRIFTYSPLKAKIENLNIYKLVSSE